MAPKHMLRTQEISNHINFSSWSSWCHGSDGRVEFSIYLNATAAAQFWLEIRYLGKQKVGDIKKGAEVPQPPSFCG